MCSNSEVIDENFKAVGALPQDDVDQRSVARAPISNNVSPKIADDEVPLKKRRTRRRKNRRRHPYLNPDRKSENVIKPEAPHNSNQFLIEDQGNTKEIDERLKNDKGVGRTRDSSFSMDSDGEEFYSSPDDEEQFLKNDFNDTYESLRVERLNTMSKTELIEEFLKLEKCVDSLTKRIKGKSALVDNEENEKFTSSTSDFQKEIERLLIENETLKRENTDLRNKMSIGSSGSEDSESDSSETCSSCSSSVKVTPTGTSEETTVVDYTQTNGHSPNLQTV